MNEPIFGALAGFQMPNIIMLPAQFRSWIRDYLGPMMEDAGFGDVKIIALDDERSFMAWYAEAVSYTFQVLQSIKECIFKLILEIISFLKVRRMQTFNK